MKFNRSIVFVIIVLVGLSFENVVAQNLTPFVEYGATLHGGNHNPLWQTSMQHGLSSLKNNTYLRGGVVYSDTLQRGWTLQAGADLAVAAGLSSIFKIQQIYADIRYKWIGLRAGMKEEDTFLLNSQLGSGGLVWSGNASPIPQISLGILDYYRIAPRVQFKIQLSYGWFTDGKYQREHARAPFPYVRKIKYHHKSFYFQFGSPTSHWLWDMGIRMDSQFGGYATRSQGTDVVDKDLGNGFKDYFNAFIPYNRGEGKYFDGNYLGSEHFKLTYRNRNFSIAAYMENFYEDFSGMGKQNGMDGLFGIECQFKKFKWIDGMVLEYLQTTHQSGPLHGEDEKYSDVGKTGGADDYYNHFEYVGWEHYGMSNGNPLIVSPIYNENGSLAFQHNRVRAFHLGWGGAFTNEWSYRAKMSFNRSWGTPFKPLPQIMENFSFFVEGKYIPERWKGWQAVASLAFDTGSLYGDNFGVQLKIRKSF